MNSWILPRSEDGVTISSCSADANPAVGKVATLVTNPETTTRPVATSTGVTTMSENKKATSVTGPLGTPVGTTPDVNDILCGRGRGYFDHPGNRRMIEFVKRKKLKYRNGSRQEKAALAEEVLKYVLCKGGRFLKRSGNPDDPNWYIASTTDGYRKICHCLRDGEKHRKIHLNPVSVAEPEHISHRAPQPAPGSDEVIMSVSALYKKWKDANRRTIQGADPSLDTALVRAEEDEDIFADAQEEPFGALAAAATYAPNLPRTQLDILLGTAMASLRGPNVLVPIRIPAKERTLPRNPSSSILRKSSAPKMALELSGKRNAAIPRKPLKQELKIPLNQHPTCLTPSPPLVAIKPVPSSSNEIVVHKVDGESCGILVGDPTSSDILFGEDSAFYNHPGNVQLRTLIDASVGYLPLSVENKIELSHGIVSETVKCGARFLTRQGSKGIWYRISEEETRVLIMRCLDAEVSKKSAMRLADQQSKLQAPHLQGSPSSASISQQRLEREQLHGSTLRQNDSVEENREISQSQNDRKIVV